jgi:alanine dehydrogenase
MLIISNEEIQDLITLEECIPILEELYRDAGHGKALNSPRVDNIIPCSHTEGYYAFKHMGGTWPRHRIQALRINSDIITHPNIAAAKQRH